MAFNHFNQTKRHAAALERVEVMRRLKIACGHRVEERVESSWILVEHMNMIKLYGYEQKMVGIPSLILDRCKDDLALNVH